MIFKTTEELKKYLPLSTGFSFSEMEAILNSCLESHIHPWLSKAEYNLLDTSYNSTAIDTKYKNLLPYAQRALAWAGLYKYAFVGDKTIGTQGINVNSGEERQMIAQWRLTDLKEHCQREYDISIDQLLTFLEDNKSTYTTWSGSASYTVFKECFINTTADFDALFKISNSRKTFLSMRGIMKRIELFKIKPILGSAQFSALKTAISSGNISNDQQALLNFISPAVALLTGAQACYELPVILSDEGVFISSISSSLSSEVKSPAPRDLITARAETAQKDGLLYLEQLRAFLYANHSTYPLYEADPSAYLSNALQDPNYGKSSLYIM